MIEGDGSAICLLFNSYKKVKIDFAERDQPHDLVPMCQHKC